VVPAKIRIAAAQVEKATSEHATSADMATAGIARLLTGDRDQAINLLSQAVRLDPESAAHRSDLAAAHLARDQGDDTARAADLARQALALVEPGSQRLPEAQFNLALALELLGRTVDALAAWEAYLTLDPSSPWANEARSHRATLGMAPAR
jgi:tetratricopeptide (TPR) repeat protein